MESVLDKLRKGYNPILLHIGEWMRRRRYWSSVTPRALCFSYDCINCPYNKAMGVCTTLRADIEGAWRGREIHRYQQLVEEMITNLCTLLPNVFKVTSNGASVLAKGPFRITYQLGEVAMARYPMFCFSNLESARGFTCILKQRGYPTEILKCIASLAPKRRNVYSPNKVNAESYSKISAMWNNDIEGDFMLVPRSILAAQLIPVKLETRWRKNESR